MICSYEKECFAVHNNKKKNVLTDAEETEEAPVLMPEVRAEAVKCPHKKNVKERTTIEINCNSCAFKLKVE